jgi:chemotaxis protein methyltransferase CheR
MNFSESLLQDFAAFVEATVGICAAQERRSELLRGIAALTRGLDAAQAEAHIRRLMMAPTTPARVGMLARCFAVGETYFFREPAVFHVLEYEVLPPLIAARRLRGKRLCLWSAGCCSGEETYSLAILLHRLIPDFADWDITVLGTDIHPDFLQRARLAAYRDWSFRNVPEWIRQRYFTLDDQGCYVLHDEIARRVRFAALNLVDETFPYAGNGTEDVDILLCRNVLMYFSPARAKQVAGRLRRALAGDGWLVVGQAEAGHELFSEFSCVQFPGALFYRNDSNAAGQAQSDLPCAFATATDGIGAPGDDPQEFVRLAKSCADRGLLAAADRWCEAAIRIDKCNAGLRYLRATVLEQQGLLEPAMALLREAIYLDRDFVLAHFALGNLYRRRGRITQARRHMANAAALLRSHEPDDALPEAEGMTAGWLSELIHAARNCHDDTQKSQA